MIQLLFPDGTLVRGSTWREVEDQLRAQQWTVFASRRKFRREFARRAILWGGPKAKVPTVGPSKRFIKALAKNRLASIYHSNERGLV